MERVLLPTRIVLSENTVNTEAILTARPLQIGFESAADYTVIKKGGFILVDFGKEIRGGINVAIRNLSCYPEKSNAKCRIVFGESVMETLSEIGYKNATNDHAIRDTVTDAPWMGNLKFGNTGFRFFKIEALDADITIKAIKAELDSLDIEPIGDFYCSDERLNRIWQVAAYTVYLNMGEYLWDGIKRDRLVWLGDMHPEASTIYTVYGCHPCLKNSLDLIKAETPTDKWINTIPSYSFWWVINQYDYYMHSGELEYLKEQVEYAKAIVRRALVIAHANSEYGISYMVDWSSKTDPEARRVGFYAVMYKCFACADRIGRLCGDEEISALAKEGMAAIEAIDTTLPNQKQMGGVAVYSGLKDAKTVNDEILSKDPVKGLSTFMGYYVLLARGMADDVEGAIHIIKEFWGAMLDLGATSFWEDFDIDWVEGSAGIDSIVPEGKKDIHGDFGKHCYIGFRHSLCHGWAGGPAAFLSQYVLGVHIAEAGCKKLIIKPRLAGLEFVKGRFPTPYGAVEIEHRRVGEKVISTVMAPEGVSYEIENAL